MKTLLIDASSILFPVALSGNDNFSLSTSSGMETTCIFAFLSEILDLSEKFQTNRILIAFDSKHSNRKKMCSTYKANRKTAASPEIKERMHRLYDQIPHLKEFLAASGFQYYEVDGFEADDIIASLVYNNTDYFIIVSNDHDMFQLLSDRTVLYRHKKQEIINPKWFSSSYSGLPASEYWKVLSIAGCTTDNVQGVTGEKTATKFLTKTLSPKSKTYEKIKSSKDIIYRNQSLVRLPLKDTPILKSPPMSYDLYKFGKKCEEYEFSSFLEKDLSRWQLFFNKS